MTATAFPVLWSHPGGLLSSDRRRAVSPEGDTIRRCVREAQRQAAQSLTMSRTSVLALRGLDEAAAMARQPNWDGYGALALDMAAHAQASDFLCALPSDIPLPDLSVDPDGEVSIEWHFTARHILTVSINGQGRIAYAASIGVSKIHGTEWQVGGVPRPIIDTLGRLLAAANRATASASRP